MLRFRQRVIWVLLWVQGTARRHRFGRRWARFELLINRFSRQVRRGLSRGNPRNPLDLISRLELVGAIPWLLGDHRECTGVPSRILSCTFRGGSSWISFGRRSRGAAIRFHFLYSHSLTRSIPESLQPYYRSFWIATLALLRWASAIARLALSNLKRLEPFLLFYQEAHYRIHRRKWVVESIPQVGVGRREGFTVDLCHSDRVEFIEIFLLSFLVQSRCSHESYVFDLRFLCR